MSNRVFLVRLHTHDADVRYSGDDDIIAGSSYVLPILWCSVFIAADIRQRTIRPRGQSNPVAYPVLLMSTAHARERVAANRPIFTDLFPTRTWPFYDEWAQLLATLESPYIMLDTLEVWGMADEPEEFEAFDQLLDSCVRAFQGGAAEDWVALVNQTRSLHFDPASHHIVLVPGEEMSLQADLHGYRWLMPVPWQD